MVDELTTLRARYNLAWDVLGDEHADETDRERANETLDEITPRILELCKGREELLP